MQVDGTPPRVEDEREAADFWEFWDELTGEYLPAELVCAPAALRSSSS